MRSKPQLLLAQQISQIQSLLQEGKIIEAEHQAQNLLQEAPNNEELHLLIAKAYQALGKVEASVTQLTNLLKLNQHHAEANKLLAKHYFNSSDLEAALTHINIALEKSSSQESQELKGLILAGLHEYDKAIEIFLKVIDSEKASWLTWNNLANQYRNLGLFKEAKESYLKAIELSGFNDIPYNNLITSLHYLPDSKKHELKLLYKKWEEIYSRNISAIKHQADINLKNKTIRIGMVSDGFRSHPVGQMITSALEELPEHEVELYAYSTNTAEDQLTYRIKKASKKWMSVTHISEEQLAEKFIDDKIDILFDLCGHNNGCRMRTMAMKPAPVIVKWVGGLINTTGLSTMDYLLSDSIETPAGEDDFYTEKLIRMPDDYICYDAPIYTPDIYSPPAKRNGYITLGCFNNPTKLNAVLLSEWAKIMHSLPESRLFLKGFQFSSKVLRENIRNQLKDLGITEERVLIEGPSHHEELLKSYNKVDIALDTWPYSGGLTTCEAMYMGVPVVTFPGPTFAGRHSATHLTNAGMPQLVAESWEHYHDLVVMLASDIDNLANIRQHLRSALLESPVCDAKRFARNFSNSMRAIWQRHCEGKQPAALTLDKEGNAQFEDEAEPVVLQLPEEPVLVEDDDFHFRFNGKIVVVDHGAGFTCSESFHTLHKLGTIKTLCIDPGSRIRNAQQLANTGDFHHFPLTVLGDGSEMELALAVEAERSTTLPIREPDPNVIIPEQEPPVLISTTKVTSNRIDDIDGLEYVDWLILDNQHRNLSILEHGQKKLTNTLLIEAKVSFSLKNIKEISLTAIQDTLTLLDLELLKINKSQHDASIGQVIFIPNSKKLAQLNNDQIIKLAFILETVHSEKEMVYELLKLTNPNLAEKYFETKLADPLIIENEIQHKDDENHSMFITPLEDEYVSNPSKPTVSIMCATYNHELYIEDAIQGFLSQKTNFHFEIIIHDDASTDNTASIIKKYKKDYPHLIFSILQRENQYSKNRKPLDICLPHMNGKYIAICEGDDFWTDPNKLQKQYDFMENNKDYSCCYHNSFILNKDRKISESKIPKHFRKDYHQIDLLLNNCFISTQSLFFRKYFSYMPKEKGLVANGDNFLFSQLGLYGKGKYLNNISPTAYRLHESSTWSSKNQEEKLKMLSNTFRWISLYHERNGRIKTARAYKEKIKKITLNPIKFFCIGRGKTGTTSLKAAFSLLGYDIANQREAEVLSDKYYFQGNFKPIVDYCRNAEVFQDAPFSYPETFKHLDKAYPGSKFILTIRDSPEQWYQSITRFHAKKFGKNGSPPTVEDLKLAQYISPGYMYNVIRLHGTTDEDPYHKETMISHYNKHNKEVIEYFKERPEDLLIINISKKGEYERFIDFINTNSPYDDFPWENKT